MAAMCVVLLLEVAGRAKTALGIVCNTQQTLARSTGGGIRIVHIVARSALYNVTPEPEQQIGNRLAGSCGTIIEINCGTRTGQLSVRSFVSDTDRVIIGQRGTEGRAAIRERNVCDIQAARYSAKRIDRDRAVVTAQAQR
jgi:hypothetical protein